MVQIIFGEPATTVNDDHDRMLAFGLGQAQFAELQRIIAIRKAVIGGRFGQLLNVGERSILRLCRRRENAPNKKRYDQRASPFWYLSDVHFGVGGTGSPHHLQRTVSFSFALETSWTR